MAKDENINVNVNIETSGTENVGKAIEEAGQKAQSLKAQLREATLELQALTDAPVMDEAKIQAAAKRVGELKDQIGDANDLAKNFSGNTFENMSSSLGGVKNAILNLDFSKASDMAKNFAANAKNINFGGAISSVKDLGSTFMTVGRALLTNPLFLIGTVIAVLVVAIVKVMDKMGILKKVIEALTAPLQLVMKGIEFLVSAITDMIGITSEAERAAVKAQEEAAAASERTAKRVKNANEEQIQTIDMKIAIAKAEGKETVQLERQKLQAIRETMKADYDAALQKFKLAVAKGDVDAKEIADLKEKARVARLAYADSKNDIKVFEAETLAEKKKANEKKQEEDDKAAKTAASNAAARRKEALEKQKEYEKLRLDTSRQIEDLRNSLIVDNVEREIAINKTKYERLIADTNKNEKLLADEKLALVKLYESQRDAEEKKIYDERDAKKKEQEDKDKEAEQKKIDDAKKAKEDEWNAEKELMDLRASYIADDQTRELEERQNLYKQELHDLKQRLDEGKITQDDYNRMITEAERRKNEDIDTINEDYANKEKERRKSLADQALGVASSSLSAISSLAEAFAGKSEKAAKKAFKVQKAAQIAQATIDTYKAATGAFSSLSSIPVVGPVLGAFAAAAAIAAGIANIKKIASTEFKPEGGGETPSASGGGGGGDTASLGADMATGAPTPPSLSLQGSAMTGGTGTGTQLFGARQTPIRAVVLESDITNTQNRLSNYQQRAEIG